MEVNKPQNTHTEWSTVKIKPIMVLVNTNWCYFKEIV